MYTAEFVSKRHPDKMCDQISDAILDHCLKLDPLARVAVEVMGGHGAVVIMGEITVSDKKLLKDFDAKAEEIVARITGHTPGFLELTCNIVPQSADIKKGVDKNNGAGDQGIMRGYAVRDTPELMPLEYILARNLCDEIFKEYPYDGKTQITIDEEKHVTAIVASFQYASSVTLEDIVKQWIITNNVKVATDLKIFANPAGDWKTGGFDADTGLTGRKLMVDNYGPRYAIGGGCFSGKDSTKVDRSGAYIARKMAVELLEANEDYYEVSVEIAYAIGVAEPVALQATGKTVNGVEFNIDLPDGHDLTPSGIIKDLNLRTPIFEETAQRGHFGNTFGWR